MMEEGPARVEATYGDNYQAAGDQGKYDPDNLFRVNQNIAPKGAGHGAGFQL